MKKLKLFFACLLMAVLSIGQVWGDPTYKLTQVSSVSAGNKYVFEQSSRVMNNTITSNALNTTATYSTTGLDGTESYVWLLEAGDNGKFYFKNAKLASNQYLNNASSGNLSLGSKSTQWRIQFTDGIALIDNPSNSNRFLGYNNNTDYRYKAYASSNLSSYAHAITVYILEEEASCSSEITITKGSNPANGTFVIDNSGKVCIDAGNATVNVTATPNEGYHLATVTSDAGTVGDIDGNTCAITGINANTTINVTFAANPKYTVSFNVGASSDVIAAIEEDAPGAGVTLPAGPTATCASDGWVFAGWKETTAVAEATTTAPTLLSGTYHPAANCTLYAVYKKSSGAATEQNVDVLANDGTFDTDHITFTALGGTLTFTQIKATSSTNVNSTYSKKGTDSNRPRVYKGQTLKIESSNYKITKVEITVNGTNYGNSITASDAIESDGSVTDNTDAITKTLTTTSGGTHTFAVVDEDGVNGVYIQNVASATNVQLHPKAAVVYYLEEEITYHSAPTCTPPSQCKNPTFSPVAGEYNAALSVTLASADDADIYYTLNGTTPSSGSTKYTEAISVDKTMTIKAIAIKDGLTDSEVAEAAYTLKCLAPTITKTPKHFLETANVTITCADGETIHYTTNGSDPTTSSATYTDPFEISETTNVKAIAVKANWENSTAASETFTKAETPLSVADARGVIDGGTDLTGRYVVGTIYQIDSYNSTYHSLTYWISDDGTSTTPLQVYSGKGLDGADFAATTDLSIGDVVTVYGTLKLHNSTVYEFDKNNEIAKIVKNVATPAFAPLGSGFLSNTLEVSLATTETGEGVEIRYTTDGSEPTSTSTLYENPIEISGTTTFKAATFKGGNASAVVEKRYVKGTKITVAQALEALDSNDPIADQFVYGIVSTAPTYLNNGKLTYSISDDGTTTSQLKVYNGYNLAGANFTDKTDIQVGDLVTVFGELTEYNSEKEFSQGNHLVEFARLADPELSWSAASAVVGITGDKNYPSIVNPHTVTGITYSSSDPTVASFANENTYEITLHKAGTVTITATYSAGNGYKNDEASYTLEVRDVLAHVTITYDCDGATTGCPDPAVVENQTNLPNPLPTVTKSGFNFGGWFTNSAKTEAAVPGDALTADVTLYAKWIEIPTFNDPNYEWQLVSGDAQLIAGKYYVIVHTTSGNTMTKSIDSYATVVASTIEDGVIAYNALGANAAVFQLGGTSAAWTLTEATTGDLLGATTGKNFSWEYNQAWTIEIEDNDASITNTTDGCGVICYNTSANPKRFKPYASSNSGTPLPQLYVWAEKVYKLRYDANGGTNAPAATPAENGEAIVTSAIPTAPTDKIFERWNTQYDGNGTDKAAGDVIDLSSADVTLYAIWRDPVHYAVSYNANGGTLMEGESDIDPEDVTEGTQYTVKENVYEKEGFVFGGWEYAGEVYQKGDKFIVTEDVPFVAKWNELQVTDFVLVTNMNQLQDGDKVYIVAAESEVAMSTQNSGNYRNYISIGKSSDNSHIIAAEGASSPAEFTLGKDGVNFTFFDGEGYLYASSSSKNQLNTQTTLDDNGKWAITIDGEGNTTIVAQGTNTNNELKWNSTTPRFSCYGSNNNQQPVVLYKKLNYTREVPANQYGTICLPKAGTISGATIYEVAYFDNSVQKIFFDEVLDGKMEAGMPYIFLPDEDVTKLEVVYTDAENKAAGNHNGLWGSYVQTELPKDGKHYILYNNQYWEVNSTAYVGANRGYLKIGGEGDDFVPKKAIPVQQGRRRVAMGVNGKQTPTGFEDVQVDNVQGTKVLINNRLFILRGEKMYDATGRLVK